MASVIDDVDMVDNCVANNIIFNSSDRNNEVRGCTFAPSVKIEEVGLDLSYFYFFTFYFPFNLFFHFLFLEQLGLGLIGHAVTSVTT